MRIHLRKADIIYFELKGPFPLEETEYAGYRFERQEGLSIANYLKMYKKIGAPWYWSGRLLMSDEKLKQTISASDTYIYFLKELKNTVGYFELKITGEEAELVYFGLCQNHIGHGLGKLMMNKVKAVAQEKNLRRLWLHTCSFDSPKAVEFYLKSGFRLYKKTSGWEKHLF